MPSADAGSHTDCGTSFIDDRCRCFLAGAFDNSLGCASPTCSPNPDPKRVGADAENGDSCSERFSRARSTNSIEISLKGTDDPDDLERLQLFRAGSKQEFLADSPIEAAVSSEELLLRQFTMTETLPPGRNGSLARVPP